MQKVVIFGIKRQRRQVLDLLQGMGVLQIEDARGEPIELGDIPNYEQVISDYEFAVSFLGRFMEEKSSLMENFTTRRETVLYGEMKRRIGNVIRLDIVSKVKSLEKELFNLDELEKGLDRERALLEPWVDMDVILSDLSASKNVRYFTGMVPEDALEKLKDAFDKQPATLHVVNSTKTGAYYVVIAVSADYADDAENVLLQNGFNPAKLPVVPRKPSEEIENINAAYNEMKNRREAVVQEARSLALMRFDVMLVHDYFMQRREALRAEKKAASTKYTFSVEGWIRKRDVVGLREKLAAFFPEVVLVEISASAGEIPPVAIDNKPWVKPFEAVTNIYGFPAYNEIDPTPLLAAFFITFFGLCIGDAGYGITLSLVAYLFYKKVGSASSARKLLKLLIYGGVATTVAGILTGGWFGIEPVNFPAILKPVQNFLMKIRIIDPLKNTLGMLALALSLGIMQVIFGIAVSFYIKIRNGNWWDGFLDDFLWIIYLAGLVFIGIDGIILSGRGEIGRVVIYTVVASAILLVLTQGRRHKNPFIRVGIGFLSLYKTVGYLSDILSYSRILALGLATSIIAMVVNLVASMTRESIPLLGYIIMLIVLVCGHMFNIAVNVLGSFIHSSRLQFVEFFSKFMAGGGDEFRPFKRESKFVRIV